MYDHSFIPQLLYFFCVHRTQFELVVTRLKTCLRRVTILAEKKLHVQEKANTRHDFFLMCH